MLVYKSTIQIKFFLVFAPPTYNSSHTPLLVVFALVYFRRLYLFFFLFFPSLSLKMNKKSRFQASCPGCRPTPPHGRTGRPPPPGRLGRGLSRPRVRWDPRWVCVKAYNLEVCICAVYVCVFFCAHAGSKQALTAVGDISETSLPLCGCYIHTSMQACAGNIGEP